ncbi:hypothetical protein IIA79_07580, partial [bacterium]|nr:hypothetical protein [bacterium]
MSPATRRFYRRYQAYTVLLPVYSSAALIYGLGLMTYHPPEWLSLPKFLMPGMFLFFVCFAATEVCTHIGF